MKTHKSNLIKVILLPLCLIILNAECNDDEQSTECLKGKVIQLDQSCYKLIEILDPNQNGELSVGTKISFNTELYPKTLKVGDIVYFKVIEFAKYEGEISAQPCQFPQFNAIVKFCTN